MLFYVVDMPLQKIDMFHQICLSIVIIKYLEHMLLEDSYPVIDLGHAPWSHLKYLAASILGVVLNSDPVSLSGNFYLPTDGSWADSEKLSDSPLVDWLMLCNREEQGELRESNLCMSAQCLVKQGVNRRSKSMQFIEIRLTEVKIHIAILP